MLSISIPPQESIVHFSRRYAQKPDYFEPRLELWAEDKVFCFELDTGQRFPPFEWIGLHNQPLCHPPDCVGEFKITYGGQVVAAFSKQPTELVLRLYVSTPVSDKDDRMIPQHVGGAIVRVGEPGPVPVFAHSDNNWLKTCISCHAYASCSAGRQPTGVVPPQNVTDLLIQLYDQSIEIDLFWLYNRAKQFAVADVQNMVITPPSQAMNGLPIFSYDVAYKGKNKDQFRDSSGLLAQSYWDTMRGHGVAPATPEWYKLRLREVLALRGRRRQPAWQDEFKQPLPESEEEEFMGIVERCLLAKDADLVKPGAHHKDTPNLHNWARECVEDVICAISAHPISRRYVFDHRWEYVHGVWTYNGATDDNTLSLTIGGDCEDSNSSVYYLALWLLQQDFKNDPLLYAMRACLLITGVPICISGSSEPPSPKEVEQGSRGSHLFGFFVPFRHFARQVWGPGVQGERAELDRLLRVGRPLYAGLSDFVYQNAFATLMVSSLRAPPVECD